MLMAIATPIVIAIAKAKAIAIAIIIAIAIAIYTAVNIAIDIAIPMFPAKPRLRNGIVLEPTTISYFCHDTLMEPTIIPWFQWIHRIAAL